MKKFEHTTDKVYLKEIDRALKLKEDEGWELVSAVSESQSTLIILFYKREKIEITKEKLMD